MEELLNEMTGKKIDVNCGTAAMYRGEVVGIKNGVLHLRSEEEADVFLSVDKIASVSECKDLPSRPGFVV